MPTMNAVGLLAVNSVEFAARMLRWHCERIPVVAVKSAQQVLPGVSIDHMVTPHPQGGWLETDRLILDDDPEPAFITLTSGTEGDAKPIVVSRRNVAATVRRIASAMDITGDIREYAAAPVTHSFGIYRARSIAAAGGRLYIPTRGFDPNEFVRMLRRSELNALSCVPSLLRVILSTSEAIGAAAANLRWLEIGAQPLSAQEKAGACVLFPNARIVYSYGLTEAPRSALLALSDARTHRDCIVGSPGGDSEIQIAADGRIQIKGPHVSEHYIGANGMSTLTDSQGWLQTNDFGHITDGQLLVLGRADELINSGGVKLRPETLESMILAECQCALPRIAVVRIPDALRGDGILVVSDVPGADATTIRRAASDALKALGVVASVKVWLRPDLPYTESGKLRRNALRDQFLASGEGI